MIFKGNKKNLHVPHSGDLEIYVRKTISGIIDPSKSSAGNWFNLKLFNDSHI